MLSLSRKPPSNPLLLPRPPEEPEEGEALAAARVEGGGGAEVEGEEAPQKRTLRAIGSWKKSSANRCSRRPFTTPGPPLQRKLRRQRRRNTRVAQTTGSQRLSNKN